MMETPPSQPPTPARRSRRGVAIAMGVVLAVLVVLGGLAAAASWLVLTAPGNAWLLSRLPGVVVTAPRGTLLGDFDAERIEVQLPGSDTLVIDALRWRGLRVQRGNAIDQWLSVEVDELGARRIDLRLTPKPASDPTPPPASLRLPLSLQVKALQVGEFRTGALGEQPLRDLRAALYAGADGGAKHRIDALSVAWGKLRATGSVRIETLAPMALVASVALAQEADGGLPAWASNATLTGPLAAPTLQATLRASPAPTRAAQSLDLTAGLRPFERWPLGDLKASTEGLDLSAFHAAAPLTALSGTAQVATAGLDQPAVVSLSMSNAQAGRWDQGRLPVRRVSAELRGRPDDPRIFELKQLDAELGSDTQDAGRLAAQGRWAPERWNLDATLQDLQPVLLDARAPAIRLGGPLTLTGTGFDSSAPENQTIDVLTDLTGQLAGAVLGTQVNRQKERAVRLKLDARLNALRVELRDLQARTGGAQASLKGTLVRPTMDAVWQVSAEAALVDFDPSPWWPGPEDTPWRKGPHRLNAKGSLDLTVPPANKPAPWQEQLSALRGTAKVTIDNSLLAGVPLSGEANLSSTSGAQAVPALKLTLGGNRISAEGRISTTTESDRGAGRADRWEASIDAPNLDRLAPLWRLFAASGQDSRLAGSLSAKLDVEGRWPDLQSQGELDANALRVDAGSVERAQARWRVGTAVDGPLESEATLTQPAWGEQALESVQLQLKGSGRAHSLEVRAISKLLPPAWVDVVQPAAGAAATKPGAASPATVPAAIPASAAAASAAAAASSAAAPAPARAPPRSLALLQAHGGWLERPDQPRAGWRGRIDRLEWLSQAADAVPWLRTRDVDMELQWAGGPVRVAVQPARLDLLGGTLQWSRLSWQQGGAGGAGQIDVQAQIEPIPLAPVLARLQPNFGWGGDLLVGGRISLRSAPSFVADVVIERSQGDLSVTDETGTQTLGLSDLRLALDAKDGVWSFSQALAGKTLGVGAGAVVVRTSPQALWPEAAAPVDGVLELQVANLGAWGTWVPAGWRLGGALRTSASISGRFGAPEYTGAIRGTALSLRNFLEGVNVSDGDLDVLLQGETARIRNFTMSGGAGQLKIDGSASFGETPRAQLEVLAERFQLLGRVDRRIITSGQAKLLLDRDDLTLTGQFAVDEGLIDFTRSDAPSLSSDVRVVRSKAVPKDPTAAGTEPAPPASRRNVDLNLAVDLGDKLRLRGRGLDTLLRGSLRITAPGGRLAVNGSVNAADGKYAAYGQKLTIDRSIISFNGAVENPRLDIEAIRPDLDEIRVGVAITGTAVNPRVRLFSVPELSEKDKLSWLLLGRASDTLGGTETALLQQAAVALLSGEGEGKTDQLIRTLGLDQLSVRQGDGEVRETVVSLGKQISRDWYVGYERSLNATAGNWQLIYRIAQSFTLRAQAGADSSFDLIKSWRW